MLIESEPDAFGECRSLPGKFRAFPSEALNPVVLVVHSDRKKSKQAPENVQARIDCELSFDQDTTESRESAEQCSGNSIHVRN